MFTMEEIELLNRPAKNDSKLEFRDGIDWNRWRFYPGTDDRPGCFTDGHDYAGLMLAPRNGWEIEGDITLAPAVVVSLMREMDDFHLMARATIHPKRKADREASVASTAIRIRYMKSLMRG